MLSLRLFGTPQVILDGVPLSFTRRKALALLIYLALNHQRRHSRDSLAALLSGESANDKARQHLRNALAELRTHLADFLLIDRETVALRRDKGVCTDVARFEDGLARPAADDGAALERAVRIYDDEFLGGFALRDSPVFEEWVLLERARLRDSLIEALQVLIDRLAQAGRDADAIAVARRLLALEPWREETHRQLMRLLARTGQRSAAIAQYETCRRVLAGELGVAPLAETTALYRRLLTWQAAPPHNLPPLPHDLVGREHEIALLADRLGDPACRLITVLGPGGCGKTSLATRVAAHYVHAGSAGDSPLFPDGIYLVNLAAVPPLQEAGAANRALALAIGDALGLGLPASAAAGAQLLSYLRARQMLLLLDNFEQVAGAVDLPAALLLAAPQVKLLALSRVRLCLREEWVLELAGLPVPAGPDQFEASQAGRLFLQLARQARVNRPLAPAEYPAATRITHLVEGLPLALVLAAGWLGALSCAEVAAQLERSLDVLATADHNVAERHRGIRATLLWSLWRIAPAERDLLRRLAVFRGGFAVPAAQCVAGATLPQLRSLRDCSLLLRDAADRYRLPALLRRYVGEQVVAPDDLEAVEARHAAYYADLLDERAVAAADGADLAAAIAPERENMLAARDWAMTHVDRPLTERLDGGLAGVLDRSGYPAWAEILGRAAARQRYLHQPNETGPVPNQIAPALVVPEPGFPTRLPSGQKAIQTARLRP